MSGNRRQIMDDAFDAFTMLAGGNYVSLYDVQDKVTRYSPGAVELFGLPDEYIEDGGDDWSNHIHPEDRKRHHAAMEKMLSGDTHTYDINYRVKISDGNYGLFRFKGAVIRNDEGKPSLIGGVIFNEGLMEYTDAVTALRNRMGFFNDLSAMQAMHQESAILLIGINRMTEINMEYGYGYGNRMLQRIGWVVQECVGHDGIVYKMDGSKFAVMSNGLDTNDMEDIYNKIRRSLQSGVMIDDVKQNITVGGGLMMVDDFDVDERAIYTCLNYSYKESKNRKHGALVSFSGNLTEESKKRLQMIDEIRKCMVNDCENFSVKYQPVIDIAEDKAVGAEALVRFSNDEYGEVMPIDFIPVLEYDYAFEEMGIWVMKKAMSDGVSLIDKNPDFMLGINIAASQFEDVFFVDDLKDASAYTGFPLRNICLELSKDCRLLDWGMLSDKIGKLRELGIRIVLDDFGSGYASLEILKEIPADFVKLDMRYVKEAEVDDNAKKDLKRLAELAGNHGALACAKGIENEKLLDIIKENGISTGQGFFYEKPVDIEEILGKYM